ncbi:hypothetical protein V3C99_017244 [Haemonchus contortus]
MMHAASILVMCGRRS